MKRKNVFRVLALVSVISIMIMMLPGLPVSAAGYFTINGSMDTSSGPTGSPLQIQGVGFDLSANAFSVSFGTVFPYTTSLGTYSMSGGSFLVFLQVPNFPRNTYTVTITIIGNTTEIVTGQYAIVPNITIDKSSGYAGDKFNISGTGFAASSTATGYFDNSVLGNASTNTYGTFSSSLEATVPETNYGNHSVKVTDSGSLSVYSNSVTYTVNPKLSASPTSADIGGQVSISGKGFTASSLITFTLDNQTLITNISTTAAGTIPATSITIPAIPAGTHTIKATDAVGVSATASISTSYSMTMSPTSGPASTVVSISGKGFAANIQVAVTFNGAKIVTNPTSVMTDGSGTFSAAFTSPATPGGSFAVAVSDGINSKSMNFTTTSTMTTSFSKGPIGSSVPLSGNGFNSGATLSIKYDGTQIATATASNDGTFSTSVNIPNSKAGTHTITVSDGVNTLSVTVSVTPTAKMATTSGNIGTDIQVTGNAFNSSSTVTIKYDSAQVATAPTDANGNFSVTFQAPVSKGGDHTIIATDGTTSFNFSFTMETTPPLTPAPVSPAKGIKADPLLKFQWTAVTDPSGVTYVFQLSQDPAFNVPIINKSGLTATSYQVTETEKLKPANSKKPYYWRVKAIDGASNESAWSTPQTFVVGFIMPAWGFYLIYIVGAIVVFLVGFIVGRKTKREF